MYIKSITIKKEFNVSRVFFLRKFFFNSRNSSKQFDTEIKATDRSKRYKLLVTINGIYSKVCSFRTRNGTNY